MSRVGEDGAKNCYICMCAVLSCYALFVSASASVIHTLFKRDEKDPSLIGVNAIDVDGEDATRLL